MIFLSSVLILWGKKKLGLCWSSEKKRRSCPKCILPDEGLPTTPASEDSHLFGILFSYLQTDMEIWKYQMLGSGMNKKRDWGGSMTLVIIIFGNHNYCSNRPLPLSPRPSAEIAHLWAKPVSAHAQPCCQHCRQSNWRPEDSIEFHAVGLQTRKKQL